MIAAALLLPLFIAGDASNDIPYAPGVKEPLFAYLYGLLENDVYGTRTTEDFREAIEGAGRPSKLPHKQIAELTRSPAEERGQAIVTVRFIAPYDVGIPYKLIIYRPGRVKASQVVGAREWHIGTMAVAAPDEVAMLTDLHVFAITDGYAAVDFDAWLDALLGPIVDDTHVSGIATFRWKDIPYGIAVGYNRSGKGSSGALEMTTNTVVVRGNATLKAVGRFIRHWLEAKGYGFRPPPFWGHTRGAAH